MSLSRRASIAALVVIGCAPRRGSKEQPEPQKIVVDRRTARSHPVETIPPSGATALRLVEHPDPDTTGVVVPDIAELPDGSIVVASSSWEADLGPGAARVADGFVAGFTPSGERRWLCLSDTPPANLRVNAAGTVFVYGRRDRPPTLLLLGSLGRVGTRALGTHARHRRAGYRTLSRSRRRR